MYRVTGQGDVTIYPPAESAIYDYGYSHNSPEHRAVDIVSVTAPTYNYWVIDSGGSTWLNNSLIAGAGNAFFPVWTHTIPETEDGEWAKVTADFRVNHVNTGRFYVLTQWQGQLAEHGWAEVTARPGNLQLTVILHKKN